MISNFVTIVVTLIIVVLFFLSMSPYAKRSYKSEIVSLGVFGTFVGIAIGLFYFDVNDIKTSMPYLLEGLKTAFITSGVGIFFSILLSLLKPHSHLKDRSETLQALETIVKEFNHNLTTQFGDNFKELNSAVANMLTWQKNYKTQLEESEERFDAILQKLERVELLKSQESKQIEELIENLKKGSQEVRDSLEDTTEIVKENMQLLLREANGRLS